MKLHLCSFIFLFLLLFNNCRKDDLPMADQNFTNIADTLTISGSGYGIAEYNLDFDKDKITDAKITFFNNYSSYSGAENYNKVTPINGCDALFAYTISNSWTWNPNQNDTLYHSGTVMVSRILNAGDTIWLDDSYTQEPIMINYIRFPTGPGVGHFSSIAFGIRRTTDYYIAFRKVTVNSKKLAWLKIRNPEYYSGLVLNSCRFIDDTDYMIIK